MTLIHIPPDWQNLADAAPRISQVLSDAKPGDTVMFPLGGSFSCKGTIRQQFAEDVTIEWNDSTFQWSHSEERVRQCLVLDQAKRCRHKGPFTFRGTYDYTGYAANKEAQHGVEFRASKDCTVEDGRIENVWGDFVYFAGKWVGIEPDWAERNTFRRMTGRKCGRQGIAIVAHTEYSEVSGCSLSGFSRSIIDIEPQAGHECHHITVKNNVFGERLPGSPGYFVASHGDGVISHVRILSNVMCEGYLTVDVVPQPGQYRYGWAIEDNVSLGEWTGYRRTYLMRFYRTFFLSVKRNKQLEVRYSNKECFVQTKDCGEDHDPPLVSVADNEFPSEVAVEHCSI